MGDRSCPRSVVLVRGGATSPMHAGLRLRGGNHYALVAVVLHLLVHALVQALEDGAALVGRQRVLPVDGRGREGVGGGLGFLGLRTQSGRCGNEYAHIHIAVAVGKWNGWGRCVWCGICAHAYRLNSSVLRRGAKEQPTTSFCRRSSSLWRGGTRRRAFVGVRRQTDTAPLPKSKGQHRTEWIPAPPPRSLPHNPIYFYKKETYACR